MNIGIYVVTHKEYEFPKQKIYYPIVAGSFEYDHDLFQGKYLFDDVDDNISSKHDEYSEFTVNYWIWKNSDADIVGINHYRRYFIRGGFARYAGILMRKEIRPDDIALCDEEIEMLFKQGINCILPKKQYRVNKTLEQEFAAAYSSELLEDTCSIIYNLYPEYSKSLNTVLKSMRNYQKCICIMKKPLFDKYSEWIFSIFTKLEELGYGKEEREFAYLGERLMNVWIEHNKDNGVLKVKELYFINTEFPLRRIRDNYTEFVIPWCFRTPLKILNNFENNRRRIKS